MNTIIWDEYLSKAVALHYFIENCYELYEEDDSYWKDRLTMRRN